MGKFPITTLKTESICNICEYGNIKADRPLYSDNNIDIMILIYWYNDIDIFILIYWFMILIYDLVPIYLGPLEHDIAYSTTQTVV